MSDPANKPPPLDATTAALAMALCDLILMERAKVTAIVGVLQDKGLLTASDMHEATEAIATLDREGPGEDWLRMQLALQERMAMRFHEVMLQFGKSGGPAQ